jgi:predicted NACHT family NTPase
VADWLGDSDLAALRPYFELSGDPVVLLLDRLSGDEQRAVLQAEGLNAGDADAFLREANDRALSDLLKNPQNLIMQKGTPADGWEHRRGGHARRSLLAWLVTSAC